MTNQANLERIKELELQLQAEKSKIEALEADSNKLFETEEVLVKVREENEVLKNQINELKKNFEAEQLATKGLYLHYIQYKKSCTLPHFLEPIKSLETELTETKRLHEEANKTISTLNEKLAQILQENEGSKHEFETIKKQYEEQLLLCASKDEEIRVLQSELLSLKQVLEQKNKALENTEVDSKEKEKLLEKEINRLKMDASAKALDAETAKDELNNKTLEIESLNKQINELKKQLELKSDDMERYQQNQSETIDILKKELEDSRSSLKLKLDELEQLSLEKSKEISQKEMELNDANISIKHTNAEIERLKAEIENLRETAKGSQLETIDRFTHQIQEKDAAILLLKNEIHSKDEEYEKTCATISKLENTVDTKCKELEKLYHELEVAKKQHHEELNTVKKCTEEINELQLKCGDLERQFKMAEEKCNILSEQKLNLEKEKDAFINSSGDTDLKLQEMSKELSDRQKTLDNIREQLAERESSYQRLEQETKLRIDNLLNEHEQQKKTYEEQLNTALEAGNLHKNNLEALTLEIDQTRNELNNTIKELKRELEEKEMILQTTLAEAAENDRQLKDELGRTTADLQRDVENYQSKLQALTAETLEAKNLVAQRTEEAIEMDAKYKHLVAQNEQSDLAVKTEFEENIRKLQFELKEKQLQIEQLNANVDELKQTLNENNAFINERDNKISTLTAHLSTNEEQLKQLQAEKAKLELLNSEQENKTIANKEECNALQGRIAELTEKVGLVEKYEQERIKEKNTFVEILNKLNITGEQKNSLAQQLELLQIADNVHTIKQDERDLKIAELQTVVEKEKQSLLEKDKLLQSQKDEILKLQSELNQTQKALNTSVATSKNETNLQVKLCVLEY